MSPGSLARAAVAAPALLALVAPATAQSPTGAAPRRHSVGIAVYGFGTIGGPAQSVGATLVLQLGRLQ